MQGTTMIDAPEFLDFFDSDEFDPWVDAEGVPMLEIDLQDLRSIDGLDAQATDLDDHYLIGGQLLLWLANRPSRALSIWTID